MNGNVSDYLDHATAGLRDDTELQLDVRAELASHVEDKAAELRRSGLSEPEAEALRALGAVTEVAAEIERGNRRRLLRRAWFRRTLRFALVPAAVLIAVACTDLKWAAVLGMVEMLGGQTSQGGRRHAPLPFLQQWAQKGLDSARGVRVLEAEPHELWQSDRDNRTYFAHHITHDVAQRTGFDEAPRQRLLALLEPARDIDPDNARYDYLRAAILLDGAAEIQSESQKGPDGKPLLGTLTWTIADRPRVDEAMGHLARGLAKGEFRRYGREMLSEQMEAMGAPRNLLEQVQRISISASALLPDLGKLRELGRASFLYGQTLADEGRVVEARPFLDAWRTLAIHLNRDCWTLIDCLVVTAIATGIPEHAALAYERLGLTDEAARTRREGALLGGPGKDWRERRNDPAVREANRANEAELKLYGGVLTRLLLPALNEWPAPADYDANRRLEYVTAMQAGQTLLSAVLLLAMLACLVISLRWRLLSNGAVIPILLLPDRWEVVRALVLGVLLPLLVFAGLSLFVPIGGQAYSIDSGLHKLLAEFVLLAVALFLAPVWLAVRAARRRCLDLGIPCGSTALGSLVGAALCVGLAGALMAWVGSWGPWRLAARDVARGLSTLAGAVGLVLLLAALRRGLHLLLGATLACCVAAAVCWCWPAMPGRPFAPGIAAAAAAGGCLLACAVVAGLRLLLARREVGLYCGTVARSLIPTFAAATIVICLTARPWLVHQERALLAQDRILMTAPGEAGFSRVENQLTERLRIAVENGAAQIPLH
jgi:hypothetical protein